MTTDYATQVARAARLFMAAPIDGAGATAASRERVNALARQALGLGISTRLLHALLAMAGYPGGFGEVRRRLAAARECGAPLDLWARPRADDGLAALFEGLDASGATPESMHAANAAALRAIELGAAPFAVHKRLRLAGYPFTRQTLATRLRGATPGIWAPRSAETPAQQAEAIFDRLAPRPNGASLATLEGALRVQLAFGECAARGLRVSVAHRAAAARGFEQALRSTETSWRLHGVCLGVERLRALLGAERGAGGGDAGKLSRAFARRAKALPLSAEVRPAPVPLARRDGGAKARRQS